jgi:hypothetical protein
LDDAITGQQYKEALIHYIKRKHNIQPEMLEQIDLNSLQHYLKSQRMHQRATTVKLIHRWVPTQDFLNKQNRSNSCICQRCNTSNEDFLHVLQCSDNTAQKFRQQSLYRVLDDLAKINTGIQILTQFENNLTSILNIENCGRYSVATHNHATFTAATKATKHQNIIPVKNYLDTLRNTETH